MLKYGCDATAITWPSPIPRKLSPVCCSVNPYCVEKTYGTPPNERYRMPRMIADHKSRKRTMSCVERRTKGVLSECFKADTKDLLASSRGDL